MKLWCTVMHRDAPTKYINNTQGIIHSMTTTHRNTTRETVMHIGPLLIFVCLLLISRSHCDVFRVFSLCRLLCSCFCPLSSLFCLYLRVPVHPFVLKPCSHACVRGAPDYKTTPPSSSWRWWRWSCSRRLPPPFARSPSSSPSSPSTPSRFIPSLYIFEGSQ